MFKIANRHPDFAAARGYRIGDRPQADFAALHSPHSSRAAPLPGASPQWLHDEASANRVRELEQ